MKTYQIYIFPRGPWSAIPCSDTLFGAICWGIQNLNLHKDLSGWLSAVGRPPFAVSGLFPVVGEDEMQMVRMYPRPLTINITAEINRHLVDEISRRKHIEKKQALVEVSGYGKMLSGIPWISEHVLTSFIQGSIDQKEMFKELITQRGNYKLLCNCILSNQEYELLRSINLGECLYKVIPVQKNHIDRLAGSTVEGMLFYESEVWFHKNVGLWCLVRANEDDFTKSILPALRYLGDTGLGANRTTGKGHFYLGTVREYKQEPIKEANCSFILSRYLVDESDQVRLDCSPLAYRITTLRPKREHKYPLTSQDTQSQPVYKQAVRMFEPGSVLHMDNMKEIYGKLALLVSQEDGGPVFQSGAAIALPMKWKE